MEDNAFVLHQGTTGHPKGAALSHHNIVNNAVYVGRMIQYDKVVSSKVITHQHTQAHTYTYTDTDTLIRTKHTRADVSCSSSRRNSRHFFDHLRLPKHVHHFAFALFFC